MRRASLVALLLGAAALAAGACGTSDGVQTPAAAPGPAPACSGATPVALTVKNYLSWCSVSVAGQAASTAVSQTVCVAPGVVSLSAAALVGFVLGPAPWHGTDGDRGSGEAGAVSGSGQSATSTTSDTVSGTSACAWVCCPFADGTGCPAATQCP